MTQAPYIVGLGGTTRDGSSSESALRLVLGRATQLGARTRVFGGEELASLPLYDPQRPDRSETARALITALRSADGVVISSPGYHGSISGLVKNALDYIEDIRDDELAYLSGRPIGLIVTASGWQAAVTTLTALRSIAHALRGWPTPFGAAINSSLVTIGSDGARNAEVTARLHLIAEEVVNFARVRRAVAGPTTEGSPQFR